MAIFKKIVKPWQTYCTLIFIGMVGGGILGAIGLAAGADYGGNYGCPALIESVFGLGYEGCGLFFALMGSIIGVIITVMLAAKYGKSNKRMILIGFILLFSLPLVVSIPDIENFIFAFSVIIMFAFLSLIPAVIIVLFLSWRKGLK